MEITNQKFYQGNTWQWTESLDGYPASDYELKVYFQKGTSKLNTTAAASNEDHVITIDATATAIHPYGVSNYEVTATHRTNSTVQTIQTGTADITKSLAATLDARTPLTK